MCVFSRQAKLDFVVAAIPCYVAPRVTVALKPVVKQRHVETAVLAGVRLLRFLCVGGAEELLANELEVRTAVKG